MNKDLDRKVFINVPNFYVRDEFFDKNSNAEIDILIAKSIETLNKKGYETRFCCSGHLKKGERYTSLKAGIFSKQSPVA